jgi:uncharacterized membrane protein
MSENLVRRMKVAAEHTLPLVPCSALACGLLAARWLRTGSADYAFLLWNLFLAWLPLGFVLAAERMEKLHWQVPWLVLWLLFFPNAPYLVSDLMHLRTRVAPLWYDTAMLAAFALAGLVLAVAALRVMRVIVQARAGAIAAWSAILGACALSGFGVYLGRFLRLNSWDAFLNPLGLFHLTAARLTAPQAHPQTWGVSVVFATLLLAVYVAFERRDPEADTRPAKAPFPTTDVPR